MEKRGQLWFVVQFILFCTMLLAPLVERFEGPFWLRALGLAISISGVIVAVFGYRTLGSSHSPWTNPIEGEHLVTTGIYHYMRHPIYTGWILGALGWALLISSLLGIGIAIALFIFYDLKSREEEKWLNQRYIGYPAYQRQVKKFIPWVY